MLGAPENVVKERLAHAALEMVAARAGCEVLQPHTDYTSIDAIIKPISGKPGSQIDVQLKGGVGLPGDSSSIRFSLKVKNYDDLRSTNVIMPRMLVVADLSKKEADWVTCSASKIAFCNSIFWIDLFGLPASVNKANITVTIPRANVLNADNLANLILTGFSNAKSGKGGLS